MKSIFCDWGTSNLRAYLIEDGKVIRNYSSNKGLTVAKDLGFANVLKELMADLQAPDYTPVYLSGMVGSKHGWCEAPYGPTPFGMDDFRKNYVDVDGIRIYGGVCHTLESGKKDVMRGEETQIFGVLQKFPAIKKICLPGTHSKWVDVSDNKVQGFSTWMTGDLFNSLIKNTIFKEQISSEEYNHEVFLSGVQAAIDSGPIMNSLFHLRTDYLFGRVEQQDSHSYLSGFLIGAEVKEAALNSNEVCLCGSETMMNLYENALGVLDVKVLQLSASEATVLGMQSIIEDKVYG
jgi:2-dehydro-3-deoxygalactonokinase